MSIFTKIPVKKPKLTLFQLNNSVKGTTQFGYEMPLRCEKVVPGDIANIQLAHRLDTAPLSTKLLQEFRNKTETFYVPTRILWKQFEEFFVSEDTSIIHPYFNTNNVYRKLANLYGSLFDNYQVSMASIVTSAFGPKSLLHHLYGFIYPYIAEQSNSLNLDFLKIFAYYFVMREYYLDENLQEDYINAIDPDILKREYEDNAGDMSDFLAFLLALPVAMAYGIPFDIDTLTYDTKDYVMDYVPSVHSYYVRGFMLRNYPKDYFTSALPWKQKGNTVMLPTSSQSEVQFYVQNDVESSNLPTAGNSYLLKFQNNANQSPYAGYKGVNLVANALDDTSDGYIKTLTGIGQGVTSVEDFMTAYELQRWLEKNARGGTRYKEQILSHFGVKTKDSRLDRPEFICGTTDVINLSQVHTTYQDEEGTGVPGESITVLNGYGRSKNVSYRVTEHGYIFTIACTFPKASYNQGVFRQGLELDKFDYFWPEFEHLGEQEILKCELAPSTEPMLVFGYTPRYAQYKSRQNEVRGEFATDLLTFTDTRILPEGTGLNSQFIQIDAVRNNLNRIFNVVNAEYDKIYYDYYVNYNFLRPMSYFGQPRLVL